MKLFSTMPVKVFGDIFNDSWVMDCSVYKMCGQGCTYCFAVNNVKANAYKPNGGWGDPNDPTDGYLRKAQKALGQGYNPDSLLETLIRRKYTTIYSNNVDPFEPAAERQTGSAGKLLSFWAQERMPIFIQTKEVYTPELFKQIVAIREHAILYCTITGLDDAKVKLYEKYSPAPSERFKRLEILAKAGMHTVVGLNPYLPDWCPDINAFFKRCADHGVRGVCTQALHFNRAQASVLPAAFKAQYVPKANQYENFKFDLQLMEQAAKRYGIGLTYGRRVNDRFVKGNTGILPQFEGDAHWLHEELNEVYRENDSRPVMVTWSEASKYYERFPILNHVISSNEILVMIARDNAGFHAAKAALGSKTKLLNVMRYLWNQPEEQRFIGNFDDCYLLCEDEDDDEIEFLTDDHEDLIRVYDPAANKPSRAYEDSTENAPAGMIEYEAPEAGAGVMPWSSSRAAG